MPSLSLESLQLHSEPLWDCPTPTPVTHGLPHHHQIRPPGTHCPCLGSWVLWGLCLSPLTLAPGLGALRRCSPGRQSHRQPATGWLPRLPFFPAWSLFPSDCRTPHQAASFPSPMWRKKQNGPHPGTPEGRSLCLRKVGTEVRGQPSSPAMNLCLWGLQHLPFPNQAARLHFPPQSVQFSDVKNIHMVTWLCNQSPEIFHLAKLKFYIHWSTILIPLPTPNFLSPWVWSLQIPHIK